MDWNYRGESPYALTPRVMLMVRNDQCELRISRLIGKLNM